ncbi:helix-turn-helix domain-containing protein [Flavilitoribacter nigricans]|uniref:HTH araC/xylS-type domain-containing protein n=1 Tax=Flavilitoribacter nigricans (strain ATCC 23147 / DSM 23189 / NBRC 102662 / NCIMB 1420 / SS-2) TaxID=1122177 RepID=A0A2D0NDX7_FLAN2|nr:helix-turn-helix transcriptional regulator [Flavilitoribacter nigricans]PHN05973.1 hypothetical protein CRP01_13445 [Flavilitoribacter nigricans DSM 23189 = NBRC 102662]
MIKSNLERHNVASWEDIQRYAFFEKNKFQQQAEPRGRGWLYGRKDLRRTIYIKDQELSETGSGNLVNNIESAWYRSLNNRECGVDNLMTLAFNWLELTISLDTQEEIFVRKLVRLIFRYISAPQLDVSFLAHRIGLSNSQLNRRTRIIINCSTGNLIRVIRLQYAAKLLLSNVASVGAVSDEVGYSNQTSFCRSFKKEFGCAPSRFSSIYGKGNPNLAPKW